MHSVFLDSDRFDRDSSTGSSTGVSIGAFTGASRSTDGDFPDGDFSDALDLELFSRSVSDFDGLLLRLFFLVAAGLLLFFFFLFTGDGDRLLLGGDGDLDGLLFCVFLLFGDLPLTGDLDGLLLDGLLPRCGLLLFADLALLGDGDL